MCMLVGFCRPRALAILRVAFRQGKPKGKLPSWGLPVLHMTFCCPLHISTPSTNHWCFTHLSKFGVLSAARSSVFRLGGCLGSREEPKHETTPRQRKAKQSKPDQAKHSQNQAEPKRSQRFLEGWRVLEAFGSGHPWPAAGGPPGRAPEPGAAGQCHCARLGFLSV